MEAQSTVTHYAILIGIDDYPERPLKSAVRDVENIKTYLESTLEGSVKIQMITASQTDRRLSDSAKDPMLRPTYNNVKSAFKLVTSLAQTGDFVYVHYSGHGTRKPPSGNFSNRYIGDLALVLVEREKQNQVKYLWGFELAELLKNMVDNGLIITLILDCCFSASVYRRDDTSTRFLPYDSELDSEYLADPGDIPENETPEHRDVSMLPSWLINPDRYAILTACGPHETAFEPKIDGQHHGALSYFLLRIIKRVGLTKRLYDIYTCLRAEFQNSPFTQNPVFYGNYNQSFMGHVHSDIAAADIPIIVKSNGALELDAGYSHGICERDEFLLYPLESDERDTRSQGNLVIAKVTCARALTSDLERLDLPLLLVRKGWIARGLTRLSLQKFPIRLAPDLLHQDDLLAALKRHSLYIFDYTTKVPFAFDVSLNNGKEYKILDEISHEIVNLPIMLQEQTSVGQISRILEHLARFRLVKDLCNGLSAGSFYESFKVCICSNGTFFGPGCLIKIQHDSKIDLVVENFEDQNLYVFVYDLGPYWQVENICKGIYTVVTPKSGKKGFDNKISKKLRMKFPDQMKEKEYSSCDDIIKVFVTSQPTSFHLLELPRLLEPAKVGNPNRTNPEGAGAASENWAAMNFPIRISL